jgi:magnesium transporter
MIQAYFQSDENSKLLPITNLEEIQTAFQKTVEQTDPHCKLWITLEAANKTELKWLEQNLKLHPLVIEDILLRNQRSKIDEYDNYLFLVLHRPVEKANKEIEWEELHLIIGKHWLVTSLDADATNLKAAIQFQTKDANLFAKEFGPLVYRLCDSVVSAFFPIFDDYDEQVDRMEDQVVEKPEQKVLDQLFRVKSNLVEMRRYLAPQRDVFRTLLDHSDGYFDQQSRLFFRDVYDHNLRVYEMLDTLRDQVSNATDLYLSVVNNNMNQVLKRLTVITTIFMPLTFITGVFGMNFGHSPQVEGDPGWFFWLCLMFIAFVGFLMYLALRRMRLV